MAEKRKKAKGRPKGKPAKRKPAKAKAAKGKAGDGEAKESSAQKIKREERDREIFRAKMRGLSPETLAGVYNLTPTTIRTIVKTQGKEALRISEQDPNELVQEYIWGVDAAIDELAALAAQEKGAARVAAVKARLEAMRDRMQILQEVGYLPRDLGTLHIIIDSQAMVRETLRILVENDTPMKVIEEIAEAWDPVGGRKVGAEEVPALPAPGDTS